MSIKVIDNYETILQNICKNSKKVPENFYVLKYELIVNLRIKSIPSDFNALP